MSVLSEITRMGRNLMLRQPFYGLFLSTLNKKVTKEVPTAGVGKNGLNVHLYVNPEFWGNLSSKHKEGLLQHELIHVCLDHITQRKKYADHSLHNIASDLVINQIIEKDYLPEGAIELDKINKQYNMNMEANQGTDYYYEELMKSPKKEKIKQGCCAGDMHETWKEFDKLSESEKKLIRKQVEYQLKETAENLKNRGSIPGELSEILDRILNPEPPKFNWKAYLRKFAGGSNKVFTKKLRRKQNRRFPDMPGLKIKQKKHILVAIDTSGSVSKAELEEFMNEIHHMHRTGTKVTVVQCDMNMSDPEEFKGLNRWSGEIHGRGGTTFTPPCEYLNAHKDRYCAFIYLTDGEGSTEVSPLKRTLWVHSSKSNINESLPGLKIKLN